MTNFNWKWKTLLIVYIIYTTIAKYHDFKLAIGLNN